MQDIINKRDKIISRFANFLSKEDENLNYGEVVNSNDYAFISGEWRNIWKKYPNLGLAINHINRQYMSIGEIILGFDDEYSTCYHCGKIVKTSPDNYGWSPNFIVTEYDLICRDCIEKDIYLLIDEYKNNSNKAIPDWSIPLIKEKGFYCFDIDESCAIFENGWHPGQNDNPSDIINNIKDIDNYDYLFAILSTGQFDIQFTLFLKDKEL